MYRYNLKFTVSEKNFVDTIPIIFEDDQIYLEAQTFGNTFLLNLDTGSSQGIAYDGSPFPVGHSLGLIESRDANLHIDTIPVVSFPPFRIGHINIQGYAGTLLHRTVNSSKYDAILGFDLFNKGLAAKIDTRNGYLILTDRKRFFDEEKGFELPYRLERFVPHVTVSPYVDCYDDALFDTGSKRLYVMNKRALELFEHEFPDIESQMESRTYGHHSIGGLGTEQASEVTFLRLDCLSWSRFAFCNVRTMTTNGSSRLGGELLRYGSMIIDPKRKVLRFQPYEEGISCTVENKQTDIAFVPRNGKPTVGLVRTGSDYAQAGFCQGDLIVSVDDHPISTFDQFLSYPFVEGRKHTFTVLSNEGKMKKIVSHR